MKDQNIKFSIKLAIIFYILAIIGCICYQIYQRKYQNWFEIEAKVIKTWYDYSSGPNETMSRDDYSEFEYVIDGKYYTNETSGFAHDVGDKVKIYVNPKNYNNTIIIDDIIKPKVMWFIIMGVTTGVNIFQICINLLSITFSKKNEKAI